MTKEEILNTSLSKTFPESIEKGAINAMDEWAKIQAIAYCSWYNSIGFLPKVRSEDGYKAGETFMKSHEELYAQFIEHQQQNKDNA